MVRVTSVPDAALAGAVKVTVLLTVPPVPAPIVTELGEVEVKFRSLVARTVYVPTAELFTTPPEVVATVKGIEMVEPGSILVVLSWA